MNMWLHGMMTPKGPGGKDTSQFPTTSSLDLEICQRLLTWYKDAMPLVLGKETTTINYFPKGNILFLKNNKK